MKKKRYIQPSMGFVRSCMYSPLLSASPNGLNNSYSDRDALSRENDDDDEW